VIDLRFRIELSQFYERQKMLLTDVVQRVAGNLLLFATLFCGVMPSGSDRLAAAVNTAALVFNRPQQDDNPKTFSEALALRQQLIQDFRTKNNLSDAEKIPLVVRMIELEKKTIAALKSGDAAFVSGNAESPQQLVEFAHSGTISNAFYLSSLYQNTKQFSKSVETLEYALLNCREAYGDDHWQTTNYGLHLGIAKWMTSATDDQIVQFQNAVSASAQGTALFRSQNYGKAFEELSRSQQAIETLGLTKSLIYGELIANKAEAVAMSGDLEKAELAFEVALQVNDSLLGQYSPIRAKIRRSFAECLRQNGKADKAMLILEQETEILVGSHGEISIPVAENRLVRGSFLQRAKLYKDASEHYFVTLNILAKLEQSNSQLALTTFSNLHTLYESVNQPADAASSAISASKIAEALWGADSPNFADWLVIAARNFRQAGNPTEAINVLTQAKTVYENGQDFQKLESYHSCLTALGTLKFSTGEKDIGIGLLREAVSLSEKIQGKDSMAYLVAAQNLAVNLSLSEKRDEAEKIFEELLPALENKLGESDLEYQRVINDRAENLFQNDKLDGALTQWKRLRSIKETAGLQASGEYRQLLNRMVELYEKMNNEPAASEVRQVLTSLGKDKDESENPATPGK
jgi:tetratricopeptide (TPR) repeat protein